MPELQPRQGRFTKLGVGWFVDLSLGAGLPETDVELGPFLDKTIDDGIRSLRIEGAETATTEEDVAPILARIDEAQKDRYGAERWIAVGLINALRAKDALARRDAPRAAASALQVMRARSIAFFYSNLNELVWRGYQALGASELRLAVETWNANQDNGDEQFWQQFFADHPVLLSYLAPGPAVVVAERVYVGGKRLDNTGGHMADFLMSNKFSGSIVILELKTSLTKLLTVTTYREGVYGPSRETSGAVSQVLTYRRSLLDEWHTLLASSPAVNAIHPKCLVVAGRYSEVGTDLERKRSLELYRNALHDVQIVTFDELFVNASGLIRVLEGTAVPEDPFHAL
jgi:hypothetical protein